ARDYHKTVVIATHDPRVFSKVPSILEMEEGKMKEKS
ncbi:MAG: ABC transporter ATP-binding protein, partial [Acidobacteria bacterium]|nr:ABC transporter ATP-binding protein [Acidobacteriota bacterium]